MTESVKSPDPVAAFEAEKKSNIQAMSSSRQLRDLSNQFMAESSLFRYTYNFSWMGRPIIQMPQDIVALQEIVWRIKPELIIETGVAHGGSLVFYASLLELIGGDGAVLGIDIDIRSHNRAEIEKHPMGKRISLLEGSSIDPKIVLQVRRFARGRSPVMVVLDSNHTHDHVLQELTLYSPLVTLGSYLVVLDTVIEDMPDDFFPDRPWGKGNNPKTAIGEFIKTNRRFQIDREIPKKLLITVAPDGYLKCTGTVKRR